MNSYRVGVKVGQVEMEVEPNQDGLVLVIDMKYCTYSAIIEKNPLRLTPNRSRYNYVWIQI